MKHTTLFVGMIVAMCAGIVSCSTPQFFTVTIHDSPQRVVRLQTVSMDESRKGYSHPSAISESQMTEVLKGLYVEADSRRRAFSDGEVTFFAPLLVRGLQQATPEEIVTFFETAEISDLHEATTSGGVFVHEKALHVILSNYGVKTPIWQDNDDYQAPYRLTPLDPIDPEPGQLIFEPSEFKAPVEPVGWFDKLKGKPWHAAVFYENLAH